MEVMAKLPSRMASQALSFPRFSLIRITKVIFCLIGCLIFSVQSTHGVQVSKQRWLPKRKAFDGSFKMACKGLQSVMSFGLAYSTYRGVDKIFNTRILLSALQKELIGWDGKFLIYKMLQYIVIFFGGGNIFSNLTETSCRPGENREG